MSYMPTLVVCRAIGRSVPENTHIAVGSWHLDTDLAGVSQDTWWMGRDPGDLC